MLSFDPRLVGSNHHKQPSDRYRYAFLLRYTMISGVRLHSYEFLGSSIAFSDKNCMILRFLFLSAALATAKGFFKPQNLRHNIDAVNGVVRGRYGEDDANGDDKGKHKLQVYSESDDDIVEIRSSSNSTLCEFFSLDL